MLDTAAHFQFPVSNTCNLKLYSKTGVLAYEIRSCYCNEPFIVNVNNSYYKWEFQILWLFCYFLKLSIILRAGFFVSTYCVKAVLRACVLDLTDSLFAAFVLTHRSGALTSFHQCSEVFVLSSVRTTFCLLCYRVIIKVLLLVKASSK